jgi:hypothetical protein
MKQQLGHGIEFDHARFVYSSYTATEMQGFAQVLAGRELGDGRRAPSVRSWDRASGDQSATVR